MTGDNMLTVDCKYLEPTEIQCFLCFAPNCSERMNADCAKCKYVDTHCPKRKKGRYCGKWVRAE